MDGPVTERTPRTADGLGALLDDPRQRVWRGHRVRDAATGVPTGHPVLDAALPEGGLPTAALTEVFVPSVEPLAGLPPGKGELALVMPALARLAAERSIVLVAPPAVPHAPAFAAAGIALERVVVVEARAARDAAWAAEQALRDGSCGAVLVWLEHALVVGLRRLQLAAEAGGALGVLYRPWAARRSASPAALRLALTPAASGLQVEVLKCRGSSARARVAVALRDGFALRSAATPTG